MTQENLISILAIVVTIILTIRVEKKKDREALDKNVSQLTNSITELKKLTEVNTKEIETLRKENRDSHIRIHNRIDKVINEFNNKLIERK